MSLRVYDGYKTEWNNIEWVEKSENPSGTIVHLYNSSEIILFRNV